MKHLIFVGALVFAASASATCQVNLGSSDPFEAYGSELTRLRDLRSGRHFDQVDAVLLTGAHGRGKTHALFTLAAVLETAGTKHLIFDRIMFGEPSHYNLLDTPEVRRARDDQLRFLGDLRHETRVLRSHTIPRVERQAHLDAEIVARIDAAAPGSGDFVLVDLNTLGGGNSPYRTADLLDNLVSAQRRRKFKLLVTLATPELNDVRQTLSDRAVERVVGSFDVIDLDRIPSAPAPIAPRP